MVKKTVVITGSTRGIGYHLALQFLRRNHQVIINGRNTDKVLNIVAQLEKDGGEIIGVPGDITNEKTLSSIIETSVKTFQKIDIWINNAGIPQSHKNLFELNNDEIKDVTTINIIGTILGTKIALNFFKKQGFGKIFNMEGFGSDGRMMKKLTLYGTSKRAVNYFTKSVSKETTENTIQVGMLSPGMVKTDFLTQSMASASKEEQEKARAVFDILAEDVEIVTNFLVKKILKSSRQYDRIEFLTFWRFMPKLIKLLISNFKPKSNKI